jgi:dihydroorotase
MNISIQNGRLIDPANQQDSISDLHIANGRVLSIGQPPSGFHADQRLDARGLVVCPGLVDLHVQLREPGFEYKANIASETAAAASGGITSLCCAPDTDPVIDSPAVVELIRHQAQLSDKARVLPIGALTQGLKGEIISEMAALKAAGCVALSNGLRSLCTTLVERRALEYATTYGLSVFLRSEDRHLRDSGCVHEGQMATRLGLPGIPSAAEAVAVARDLALAEHTGARVHFRCISTAEAVRLIRRARHDGLDVTADVAAHQLHLTELDIEGFNSLCHTSPPLRTLADRDALRQGLADGTISAICSDHQPHELDAKEQPFPATQPGISGLETLLPLAIKLVREGVLTLPQAIASLTHGPASILGLESGRLAVGDVADVCVFDPEADWLLRRSELKSQGHNSPFEGWLMTGKVRHTLLEGRLVYSVHAD